MEGGWGRSDRGLDRSRVCSSPSQDRVRRSAAHLLIIAEADLMHTSACSTCIAVKLRGHPRECVQGRPKPKVRRKYLD